jgi:hypothetical protein
MLNAMTLNVVAPIIVRLKINEDLDFDQQFPVLIISLKTKPQTYLIKLFQVKLTFPATVKWCLLNIVVLQFTAVNIYYGIFFYLHH